MYFEELECLKVHLDEFQVSQALIEALINGKKNERASLILQTPEAVKSYFSYGLDYEKLKKLIALTEHNSLENVHSIEFDIKVYSFS